MKQGFNSPFQCSDRLYTSESDVCRRQILTYKDSPRTGKKNNSNGRRPITHESERAS